MLSTHYWTVEFDITKNDLERLREYIKGISTPVSVLELTRRIIRGRIRYGHDISPAALNTWTGKSSIKLWDPASQWIVGDNVIVVRRNYNSNEFEAHVGQITQFDQKYAKIKINQDEVTYACAEPGSANAINWHNTVREVVAQKIKSQEIEDQVTAVLAQYGDRIVSRVVEVLEQDGRFIGNSNNWFINELIDPLSNIQVMSIYKKLIGVAKPMQLDPIKALCDPSLPEDLIGDFMLLRGLEGNPNLFQLSVEGTNKTWKAILPEPDQMVVKRYAYDPNTYEIICTPGSKLNHQSRQRLQELDLIAYVIDF